MFQLFEFSLNAFSGSVHHAVANLLQFQSLDAALFSTGKKRTARTRKLVFTS